MIAARAQWALIAQIIVIPILILIVSFEIAWLIPGVVIGAMISIAYVLFASRRRGKKLRWAPSTRLGPGLAIRPTPAASPPGPDRKAH
jgi:ABC-type Fe3+-siderophore transport system permease subunit